MTAGPRRGTPRLSRSAAEPPGNVRGPIGVSRPIIHEVLRSGGEPLDATIRRAMEPRFRHDFGFVRVHADTRAAESARALGASAYTVGRHVVFSAGEYAPNTAGGQRLLAHELAHVVQQGPGGGGMPAHVAGEDTAQEREAETAGSTVIDRRGPVTVTPTPLVIQRRAAPYIKSVTVHLTPPQTADLEWTGTPPADAPGVDHFTVSTGKGYGDPGDPPGTCKRDCCSDPDTQCAPPHNQPGRVGSCCTYHGTGYWTGTPQPEHNGWLYWTPIQPYYSSRGIALHQHTEVTGQPIGHGCVRMDEGNAQRIAEYSNGRRTSVSMDGRAAPVACEAARQCGASARADGENDGQRLAEIEPVPGQEGELT